MKISKVAGTIGTTTILITSVLYFDMRCSYAEEMRNLSADNISGDVIETMTSFAKSGPNLSLTDAEKMLGFTTKSKLVSNGDLHIVGAKTEKWSTISLDLDENESKLKRVDLTVNPNYTLLNSATAIAKLGSPTSQLFYTDHDPPQSLVYNTEHYDLVFYTPSRRMQPSSELSNSINSITVAWISPEHYLRRIRIRKAWEDRQASIGTCTHEMINWLKALVKLSAVPTSKEPNVHFWIRGGGGQRRVGFATF
jgi:hypothetical protein